MTACQVGHTSLEQTRTYCLSPACLRKIWEVFNYLCSNLFKILTRHLSSTDLRTVRNLHTTDLHVSPYILSFPYSLTVLKVHSLASWFFPGLMSVVVYILGQKWASEFRINCLKYTIGSLHHSHFYQQFEINTVYYIYDLISFLFVLFLSLVLRVWLMNTWSTIMNKNTESIYPYLTAHFREMLSVFPFSRKNAYRFVI